MQLLTQTIQAVKSELIEPGRYHNSQLAGRFVSCLKYIFGHNSYVLTELDEDLQSLRQGETLPANTVYVEDYAEFVIKKASVYYGREDGRKSQDHLNSKPIGESTGLLTFLRSECETQDLTTQTDYIRNVFSLRSILAVFYWCLYRGERLGVRALEPVIEEYFTGIQKYYGDR